MPCRLFNKKNKLALRCAELGIRFLSDFCFLILVRGLFQSAFNGFGCYISPLLDGYGWDGVENDIMFLKGLTFEPGHLILV